MSPRERIDPATGRARRSLAARIAGRLQERSDRPAPPLPGPRPVRLPSSPPEAPGNGGPIFVVGCPRSGTSLVRRILDSHSRIACPPESKFILPLAEVLRDPASLKGLGSMGYGRADVACAFGNFIGSFFDTYAASRGKVRWADKTPGYVECLPEIREMFGSGARFVLVVRDGLDVAFSLSDAHRRYPVIDDHVRMAGGNVPVGAARFWAEQNDRIEAFRTAHAEDCFQLRYERLTEDPAATLEAMFGFLGEPWEAGVLDYNDFPHHEGIEDPDVRRRREIEPNSGKHAAWPDEVQRAVREACEPMLSRLGYRDSL